LCNPDPVLDLLGHPGFLAWMIVVSAAGAGFAIWVILTLRSIRDLLMIQTSTGAIRDG